MPKTLLDCGNCGPDHSSLRQTVSAHFGAAVIRTHGVEDTLQVLRSRQVDPVTVNRKLDRDYTDGMEVVKRIMADEEISAVPVMLVTNYEEHQQAAMQAGCVRGFGKVSLRDDETRQLLEVYLGAPKRAGKTTV